MIVSLGRLGRLAVGVTKKMYVEGFYCAQYISERSAGGGRMAEYW